MNTNISNFFSNPEKFLNQSKILKQTINDLIDMNTNMEKQLDTNKLIKLNSIIPFEKITKEPITSDLFIIFNVSKPDIHRINNKFFYLLIRYITILLLLNIITSQKYKQLAAEIKIVKPDVVIPDPPVNPEPKEIVIPIPDLPVSDTDDIILPTPKPDELILYLPVNTGKQNTDIFGSMENSEDVSSSRDGGSKIGRFLFNNGIRGFVRKGDNIYIMKADGTEVPMEDNSILNYMMIVEHHYQLRNFLEVLLKRKYIDRIVLTDKGDSNMLFIFPSRNSSKTSLVRSKPEQYYYTDFLDKSFANICKDKSLSYKYLIDCNERNDCKEINKYVPVTITNVSSKTADKLNEIRAKIFNKNSHAIFKPNKGSMGAGIQIIFNNEQMNKFLINNTMIYTVQEFLSSAYTKWKDNIVPSLGGTMVQQTFRNHKVNIRPYVIVKITNNNNKFNPITKKVERLVNPPSKDNIKIEAHLHPNLIFMTAKDEYKPIPKEVISSPNVPSPEFVGSLITNLSATKGLTKDSLTTKIEDALNGKYTKDKIDLINKHMFQLKKNYDFETNFNALKTLLSPTELTEYFSTYYDIEQQEKLKLYTVITAENSANGTGPVDMRLYNIIIKQMKVIISDFLKSVKDNLFCGNYMNPDFLGCHKLFVFDTHLDANENLWYIEANTEPGLDAIHLAYPPNDKNFSGVQNLFTDIMCNTIDTIYASDSGKEYCEKTVGLIPLNIGVKQVLDTPAPLVILDGPSGPSEPNGEDENNEYESKYLKYARNSSRISEPNLNTYESKYLKYKQKYMALKKFLNQ